MNIKISVVKNRLYGTSDKPSNWEIFTIDGKNIKTFYQSKEINLILRNGIYIVKVNNRSFKVVIS